MSSKKISRQLSIFINGKEVKNSLGGIGREISKVKAKLREANDPSDIKKYKEELDKLRDHYGKVKDEIEDSNNALVDAREHWNNLVDGFLSGNLNQISSGLKGIVGNIKNITKAALAFIATPFGMALAAVSAIGLGVKKWIDYNIEIEKTNQLVRDLTQETGVAVDVIRVRAESIQEFFEVDLNESIESAKSLVKGFGISYNEAFDIIEDGALRGKLKNGEFLDSLKEYPIQFKNAGFSAQDFANIVSTGIDLSIYSDKLPDAIKEFNLAITEQTAASKEALTNAFGKEFTDKLLKGLKDGSLTAKDALALISKEADRIGLNSKQAQLLTADLFKGAGEDAGGALKIFEAVNIALNEQKKPLTEIQQIQKEQLDANKELNSVYTQLFASGSKGFNLWIQKGKLFATKTLIKILKAGVDVYNWIVDLNNESGIFSAILKGIGIAATVGFDVLGILISNAWESMKGLGNIVAGVFTFDWDRVKKGFSQGVDSLGNIITDLKDKAKADASAIYDAFNGKDKMEKLSLEDFLADDTGAQTPVEPTDPITNTNDAQASELTDEDKRIIESKKKLAEFLDQWEADRALQKELEKFEEDVRAEEEEILRLEQKLAKMEEEAGILGMKEEELSQADLELKQRLEQAKEEGIAAIRRKYAEQRQKEKDKADKEYEEKLKQHHKRLAEAEEALEQAKRKAMLFGIDTLKSMFGEKTAIYKVLFALEKAMAINEIIVGSSKSIAEITSSTAIANAKAIAASPLTGGMPWVGINSAIAAKQTLATKINAGVQIASIAASAIKGFKDGGPTGEKPLYHDQYGKVTGVVHENEWVAPKFMTQSPRYAPTLKWLEDERKRTLGQFYDGGPTSETDTSIPTTELISEYQRSDDTINLGTEIRRLNNILNEGIKTGAILIGDEQIQEFNQRNELLNQTRSAAKIS